MSFCLGTEVNKVLRAKKRRQQELEENIQTGLNKKEMVLQRSKSDALSKVKKAKIQTCNYSYLLG